MATDSYKTRIRAINLLLPELELWHLSRGELAQKWRNEAIQYEQRLRSGKISQKPPRLKPRRVIPDVE